MSKYDDAFVFDGHDTFWIHKENGKLRNALHDIHARLSALEAASKKDLTAHLYPNGLGVPVNIDPFRIPSTNAPPPPNTHEFAPTPEQREPGWYPVWKEGQPWLWRWSDLGNWVSWDGTTIRAGFPEDKYKIGPRIPEPGE